VKSILLPSEQEGVNRRSPSFVRRRLRDEWRRFVGVMWKDTVPLVVLVPVFVVLAVYLDTPAWFVGFLAGALPVSLAALIGFAFLLSGDSVYLIAGAKGEDFTGSELDDAVKVGHIWSWVPNIELPGRDVDCLVLAPSGVLAIDAKWRFRGAHEAWIAESAHKSREAARFAGSVLRSKGIDYVTEPRPVVVVWGGARRELENHQTVDGVDVVRGDHLLTWLEQCSRGRLSEDRAIELHGRLTAFAVSHRANA
jgi:hypothetical protein